MSTAQLASATRATRRRTRSIAGDEPTMRGASQRLVDPLAQANDLALAAFMRSRMPLDDGQEHLGR